MGCSISISVQLINDLISMVENQRCLTHFSPNIRQFHEPYQPKILKFKISFTIEINSWISFVTSNFYIVALLGHPMTWKQFSPNNLTKFAKTWNFQVKLNSNKKLQFTKRSSREAMKRVGIKSLHKRRCQMTNLAKLSLNWLNRISI